MVPWKAIHTAMLQEIGECHAHPVSEKEHVECAFKIAVNYWEEIKRNLSHHVFENTTQEITFYKKIKPTFTCHIEYLTLIYIALCYLPASEAAIEKEFWKEEAKKLQKFLDKNEAFVSYHKTGCTAQDIIYFLPSNYDLASCQITKIYDADGLFATSHDHLIAMLMAHEMYHQYVENKLLSLH